MLTSNLKISFEEVATGLADMTLLQRKRQRPLM